MARIPANVRSFPKLAFSLALAAGLAASRVGRLSADDLSTLVQLQPASPVAGSLLIVGGGPIPNSVIDKFFELAGGEKAKIVVVTTASSLAGTPDAEARYSHWLDRKPESLTFLHTRDRQEADSAEFSKTLLEASAVWFMGGNQN